MVFGVEPVFSAGGNFQEVAAVVQDSLIEVRSSKGERKEATKLNFGLNEERTAATLKEVELRRRRMTLGPGTGTLGNWVLGTGYWVLGPGPEVGYGGLLERSATNVHGKCGKCGAVQRSAAQWGSR